MPSLGESATAPEKTPRVDKSGNVKTKGTSVVSAKSVLSPDTTPTSTVTNGPYTKDASATYYRTYTKNITTTYSGKQVFHKVTGSVYTGSFQNFDLKVKIGGNTVGTYSGGTYFAGDSFSASIVTSGAGYTANTLTVQDEFITGGNSTFSIKYNTSITVTGFDPITKTDTLSMSPQTTLAGFLSWGSASLDVGTITTGNRTVGTNTNPSKNLLYGNMTTGLNLSYSFGVVSVASPTTLTAQFTLTEASVTTVK